MRESGADGPRIVARVGAGYTVAVLGPIAAASISEM
ncbi:hypothetical protein BH24GEM1_BH24GEM1_21500 [soil metagenome]